MDEVDADRALEMLANGERLPDAWVISLAREVKRLRADLRHHGIVESEVMRLRSALTAVGIDYAKRATERD